MSERRFNGGRPYYRPRGRHETPASDRLFFIFLTFATGCLLGATMAMGYLA